MADLPDFQKAVHEACSKKKIVCRTLVAKRRICFLKKTD